MIIGYPNKDNEKFDIIEYLILDNDNSIENITFDLSTNITIDNNVFGYIYEGIKIRSIESNDYIYLVSSTSNNIINNETYNELDKNENIKIKFKNNIYNKSECKIEYSIIVTEPEYEEFEKYPININTTYGNDNEEIFNEQKNKYIGKSIYYNIILSENLSNKCKNLSCVLCFGKNISCITYRPFIEIFTDSIETNIITNINPNIKTEMISNKGNNFSCTNQEIFQNKCKNETMSDEQIEHFYNKLKNEIIQDITNNSEITIKTQNAVFQLLSLKEKMNEEDNDISTIDLGKCFDILKDSFDNPLKILKVDIKSDDLASTFVQYEIYDSITGDKINLNICKDVTIKINVKKKLGDETLNIINNLENSGYNYLDKTILFIMIFVQHILLKMEKLFYYLIDIMIYMFILMKCIFAKLVVN